MVWTIEGSSAYVWIYLHQGGRFDIISGLYYFRNRDDSPTLGRWATLDPQGIAAGDEDPYRALGGNPVSEVDAYGLKVTKITVKPLRWKKGAWVAYAWGVIFELDDKADASKGGWIIQHIMGTDVTGKGKTAKTSELDYWEGFRVEKGQTSPEKKLVERPVLNYFYDLKPRVDLWGVKANDWFWHLPVKNTAFETDIMGDVWYIDCLESLPADWTKNLPETGGLYGIAAAGHEAEIAKFLIDHDAVGPERHDINVTSDIGIPGTVYSIHQQPH